MANTCTKYHSLFATRETDDELSKVSPNEPAERAAAGAEGLALYPYRLRSSALLAVIASTMQGLSFRGSNKCGLRRSHRHLAQDFAHPEAPCIQATAGRLAHNATAQR